MKNVLFLTVVFLTSITTFAQKRKAERDTKLWRYEIEGIAEGKEGTYLIKVWSYNKKDKIAIEQAKKNAVHGIIFKGFTGHGKVTNQPALINDLNVEIEKEEFFESFFDEKNPRGFMKYVEISNDATIGPDDIKQFGNEYKIGVVVSVHKDRLKTFLLAEGIIKPLDSFGNAKKPTIMIKPSDDWMSLPNTNFMMEFDNQGLIERRPNYEEAFIKYPNLNSVIAKIDAEMRKDGFETKSLDFTLKEIKQNRAEDLIRTKTGEKTIDPIEQIRIAAKADIEFVVYWKIIKQGPRHRIESFRLQGIDTYTNKPLAYAEGSGDWASMSEVSESDLLREAVVSKMDGFKAELLKSFNMMHEKGREVVVKISTAADWDKNLYSNFNGDELNLKIEDWINENTKNHQFGSPEVSKTNMTINGCRIELNTSTGKAQDAREWVRPLKKYLFELGVPGVIVVPVGLGKVEIFLSNEKPE